MGYNLRTKLLVITIISAVISCFAISIIYYFILKNDTIEENEHTLTRIGNTVNDSLETIEKAYNLLDDDTAKLMERNTRYLIEKYKANPNFDEWNFTELLDELGMDIYIIDAHNVVTHSSFIDDIGLDFQACCSKLANLLDNYRESGEFYHDDMDIEQQTGELRKYSYMATPDKKYLIELGYSLRNDQVFNEFNLFEKTREIKELYSFVREINILNVGGLTFGTPVSERNLVKDERAAFEETLATKETTEIKGHWNNEAVTFRYVHYEPESADDSQSKVIEIIYNEKELGSTINQYKRMFLIQLFIILAFVLLISFIIARPMYLAYHDRLTGLKNRSAFEELLSTQNTKGKKTAFFMMDLDNFKKVNDYLGHSVGDELLIEVAATIKKVIPKHGNAYRYGGDEFIIVLDDTTREEAEFVAEHILQQTEKVIQQREELTGLQVSASIGIAISPDHGSQKYLLCKRADMALYESKDKGKNQYTFYKAVL